MSYEKDKIDSFVTSASLSTALATYVTSNSLSAAVAGIDLSAYVSSNSLSAGVATDALTVRGAASVSATLSAAAVTVAARPVGMVLLGSNYTTNSNVIAYSGSWSDFIVLELHAAVISGSGAMPLSLFTDGGTTPILSGALATTTTAGTSLSLECRVFGGDGQSNKYFMTKAFTTGGLQPFGASQTANAGFINCLRVSISLTAGAVFSALYGMRKT
jgi:hypothetical protein